MFRASMLLKYLCGLADLSLTFYLLLRSPSVAGYTGHADVVPVDVLEKHLSVPPCQGAGLRETRV
jgi:hypothetical protein